MKELTKADRRALREIIKKGNLKRCEIWLKEIDELIHKSYSENENEFTRCMDVTKKSQLFFKEAMKREDYYRNTMLTTGVINLLVEGYIQNEDLEPLSEAARADILSSYDFWTHTEETDKRE